MKNDQFKLILILSTLVSYTYLGFSQDNSMEAFGYQVNKIHPYISITKQEVKEATRLIDLNNRYQTSWIKEYLSVEVAAINNGIEQKAMGQNNYLTLQQKAILNLADVGTPIHVKVKYIPKNTLKQNDPKEINFTFTPIPENEAIFLGGQQELNQYLQENIIDKISTDHLISNIAIVKFIINKEGRITNEQLFWSSEDKKADALLMECLGNMPTWIPASYLDGTKIEQEFALTIGNKNSCAINLINPHQ